MSGSAGKAHGAPYQEVLAKRSWDNTPVGIDWHDFLIKQRIPGKAVQVGDTFRPHRSEATGLQYRCTVAGVTSGAPFGDIRWPRIVDAVVVDGRATWAAEAISTTSLVATIAASNWPSVDGVTLSNEANDDLRYQVNVDGGVSGNEYEIKHRITLSNGDKKEGVVFLPVLD